MQPTKGEMRMTARARQRELLDTRTVPGLLALVALGLFLISYGAAGIRANDQPILLQVLQGYAVAAGVGFLLSAFFGARAALRQRRR